MDLHGEGNYTSLVFAFAGGGKVSVCVCVFVFVFVFIVDDWGVSSFFCGFDDGDNCLRVRRVG